MSSNRLKLNLSKSVSMLIGSRQKVRGQIIVLMVRGYYVLISLNIWVFILILILHGRIILLIMIVVVPGIDFIVLVDLCLSNHMCILLYTNHTFYRYSIIVILCGLLVARLRHSMPLIDFTPKRFSLYLVVVFQI